GRPFTGESSSMVRRMHRRNWSRADDDTDSFPVITEEPIDDPVDHDGIDGIDDDGIDDAAEPGQAAPATLADESPPKRKVPAWVNRFGDAVVARLPRISAAVAGGLLLCLSFPPFGWWYLAIVAFALL